jgi:hypothetical protein
VDSVEARPVETEADGDRKRILGAWLSLARDSDDDKKTSVVSARVSR